MPAPAPPTAGRPSARQGWFVGRNVLHAHVRLVVVRVRQLVLAEHLRFLGSGGPQASAALPADEQGQTATAPILSAANPLPPAPLPAASDRTDGRLLGVMVALCAGALLFWSSQQPTPAHRSLSRFAVAAGGRRSAAGAEEAPVDLAAAIPEEKRMGGLGGFRRVRDTPARRLGG